MKLTEIAVEKTYNLGNYENVKLRLVVSIGETDSEMDFPEIVHHLNTTLDETARKEYQWKGPRV